MAQENDMQRLQQEAVRRVREMQSRAQMAAQPQAGREGVQATDDAAAREAAGRPAGRRAAEAREAIPARPDRTDEARAAGRSSRSGTADTREKAGSGPRTARTERFPRSPIFSAFCFRRRTGR